MQKFTCNANEILKKFQFQIVETLLCKIIHLVYQFGLFLQFIFYIISKCPCMQNGLYLPRWFFQIQFEQYQRHLDQTSPWANLVLV